MTQAHDLRQCQALLMAGITPTAPAADRDAAGQLIHSTGLPAERRLSIYRQTITSTRVRALQAIHPVCQTILGEACFRALARDYAWSAPDPSPDLNRYGAGFAGFIADIARRQPAFAGLPYLGELARLEASLHAAYYAAEPPAPAMHKAGRVDDVCLQRAPGVSLHRMRYPVFEIWRRHQAGEDADSVAALAHAEHLCVFRDDRVPSVARIEVAEYRLLRACGFEVPLSVLAGRATYAQDLAQQVPRLLARGWLCLA